MYCKECGKEIDEDSIFCSFCGTKVNDARNKSSEENESLQNNENSEIFKLIFNKMLAFPVSLTSRHLVNSKEWWKYRRELYCIVQITDTGYKYIDGVVTYF